ncbi:hypothetical protein Ddye_020777 [Dipteronia dyeriana]|uniref:Uncharacterized protein n=1 Tax=Dipteronia dyeriana TaxID=168575 RepID=A0AAD9U0Z0_9ROSI|nr:hypothetical protein Ddye_020777 [Dipteronia dyeriana]
MPRHSSTHLVFLIPNRLLNNSSSLIVISFFSTETPLSNSSPPNLTFSPSYLSLLHVDRSLSLSHNKERSKLRFGFWFQFRFRFRVVVVGFDGRLTGLWSSGWVIPIDWIVDRRR